MPRTLLRSFYGVRFGVSPGADGPEQVRTALADGLVEGEFNGRIGYTVDWDRVQVPPLGG